jgi:hypothetical protein
MNSYIVDNNWYTDTGATDHITGVGDSHKGPLNNWGNPT